jgi:hypothetical protein
LIKIISFKKIFGKMHILYTYFVMHSIHSRLILTNIAMIISNFMKMHSAVFRLLHVDRRIQ